MMRVDTAAETEKYSIKYDDSRQQQRNYIQEPVSQQMWSS